MIRRIATCLTLIGFIGAVPASAAAPRDREINVDIAKAGKPLDRFYDFSVGSDYPGTLLLVSHDRDFLDRIVTSVLAPTGNGRWTEYAGGYSDMLAQRKGDDLKKVSKAESAPAARKSADDVAPVAPTTAKAKLSYKEKHALSVLPDEIAKLETEIQRLSEKLADAGLYARDRAAFEKANARLADAQRQLEDAETQWLELEEKRTAIEGAG